MGQRHQPRNPYTLKLAHSGWLEDNRRMNNGASAKRARTHDGASGIERLEGLFAAAPSGDLGPSEVPDQPPVAVVPALFLSSFLFRAPASDHLVSGRTSALQNGYHIVEPKLI